MIGWLLATHVLSELRRPRPEPRVLTFTGGQALDRLIISAVTLAEIRFGRAELNDWLACKVRPMFERRVLPVTEDIMVKWRLLIEDGRKFGHPVSQPEFIIAATALHHRLTIISCDTAGFPGRPHG